VLAATGAEEAMPSEAIDVAGEATEPGETDGLLADGLAEHAVSITKSPHVTSDFISSLEWTELIVCRVVVPIVIVAIVIRSIERPPVFRRRLPRHIVVPDIDVQVVAA
jgi:hypothetical protein